MVCINLHQSRLPQNKLIITIYVHTHTYIGTCTITMGIQYIILQIPWIYAGPLVDGYNHFPLFNNDVMEFSRNLSFLKYEK